MPPINLVRRFDGRSDIAEAFPLKPINFEHAHDINMEPAGSAVDASSTLHSARKIMLDDLWNTEVNQKPEMNNNSKKDWEYEYSSRSIPPAPRSPSPPMHRRHCRLSRSPTSRRRLPTPDSRRSRSPTPGRRRFRSPDHRGYRRSRSRSYSEYRSSHRSRSLTYSEKYRGESRLRSKVPDDLDIGRRRSARYRSPSPRDSYVYPSDRRAGHDRRDDYHHRDDFQRRDGHSHRHSPSRYADHNRSYDTRADHGHSARENRHRSDSNNTGYDPRRSAAPRPHRPGYFHGAPASPPRRRRRSPTARNDGRGIGYSASARSVQSGGQWRRPDERGWPVRGGAVRFRRGGGEGAFLGRHFVTRR